MNKTEIKQNAKKLLQLFGADGKHWTTGLLAKDKYDSREVAPKSKDADRWCLIGGCRKLNLSTTWLSEQIMEETRHGGHGGLAGIIHFNDTHRWPTIRNFLSKLIHNGAAKETKTETKTP